MNRANVVFHIENQIADSDGKVAGRIYEKEVTLTSAEILALYTTPKTLVAAPGTKKVIQFISAVAFLDFNSVAYATAGILTIKYTNGSGTAVSDAVAAAALCNQADDCYEEFAKNTVETELTSNAALVLTCDTANPTAGNSPITIKVIYCIHDFN